MSHRSIPVGSPPGTGVQIRIAATILGCVPISHARQIGIPRERVRQVGVAASGTALRPGKLLVYLGEDRTGETVTHGCRSGLPLYPMYGKVPQRVPGLRVSRSYRLADAVLAHRFTMELDIREFENFGSGKDCVKK